MLTKSEIEATVHRTIEEVLQRRDREAPAFGNNDDLTSTGLTSLDLATVVALLERELKVDPFLTYRAITEVRTVGDFCRAYEACIRDGETPRTNDSLRQAQERAARRR